MKNKLVSYLKHGTRILYKGRKLPCYVTFFITSRCNMRCSHCFYWKDIGSVKKELTLEQIDKFSRTMGDILLLALTGGEPTLRHDLPEIVSIFKKNNNLLNLIIPTNGGMPDHILKLLERVLKENPEVNLTVDISIDALAEKHDSIRGFKNAFEGAVETFTRARGLKKTYPNLNLGISMTLMKENVDEFTRTYAYVKENLKPDAVSLTVIRGDVKDSGSKDVQVRKFEEFSSLMEEDAKKKRLKGYSGFPFSSLTSTINVFVREKIAETLKKDGYVMPCHAGSINTVIYPDGDVYFCELLDKKLGNLEEAGFDFRKIWFSDRADEIRNEIKSERCFCIHDCNMLTNTLFNPILFSKVLYRVARGA